MKIAIIGKTHNGGSQFINHALLPALFDYCRGRDFGFEIREVEEITVRVAGKNMHYIALFETELEAAKWLVDNK